MIFERGVSPERKARGVTTASAFASITAIRCRACARQGSTAIFWNRSIAAAGSPFSVSYKRGDQELGVGGGLAAGELAGERLPGGDRLVELLLGHEALADLEEDLGHAAVERVLRDEVGQAARASANCSASGGRRRSGAACRGSRAGQSALCGPLGNLAR